MTKRNLNEAKLEANRVVGRVLSEAVPLLPAAASAGRAVVKAGTSLAKGASKAVSKTSKAVEKSKVRPARRSAPKQIGTGKAVGPARRPGAKPEEPRAAEFRVKDKPKPKVAAPKDKAVTTKPKKVEPTKAPKDKKPGLAKRGLKYALKSAYQVHKHRGAKSADIAKGQVKKYYDRYKAEPGQETEDE